jgi:hypothetical protein
MQYINKQNLFVGHVNVQAGIGSAVPCSEMQIDKTVDNNGKDRSLSVVNVCDAESSREESLDRGGPIVMDISSRSMLRAEDDA